MTSEQVDTQAVIDELISRLNAATLENVVLSSRIRGLQDQVARLSAVQQDSENTKEPKS